MKDGKHVNFDGDICWYFNGKLHRKDGPALIVYNHRGSAEHWYLNGKHHREGGPATTTSDGTEYWFVNDRLYREDGPAVAYPNRRGDWYLNGLPTAKFNVFLVALNKSLNLIEFWK